MTKALYCHYCDGIVESTPKDFKSRFSRLLDKKEYYCPFCKRLLLVER